MNFKFGRTKFTACRSTCKDYHICIVNIAAALRVFELIKPLKKHNKTQKVLYKALVEKVDNAMENNHQIVDVKYSFLKALNANLEIYRSQFVNVGLIDYALEAAAAMLVHKVVARCV